MLRRPREKELRMEKRAKILLVDDDIDFVEATKTVLESKPYQVIVAYQGDDGLQKARQEKPDLVLLDIIMPVRDGFTVAEQFRKDPQLSRIPVIMLTSYSSMRAGTAVPVSRGLELEAEDYLEKPVSPHELLNTVEKYLKGSA